MTKFKINDIDFTACVQESTYKVDSEDVFSSYVDANWKTHKIKVREKIRGSFDLMFIESYSPMSYDEFLSALAAVKDDEVTTATVFVNNQNTEKTIECYVTVSMAPVKKISEGRFYRKCTVNLEER